MRTRARGRRCLAWAIGVAMAAVGVQSSLAQATTAVFQLSGEAMLDVKGPRTRRGRAWQYEIPGRFRMELRVHPSGAVRLTRVTIEAGDVTVSRGRRSVARFRCNRATTVGSPVGGVDAAGNLLFPAGSAPLFVTSFSERNAEGGCPGGGDHYRITATNSRPVSGWHDPISDVFQLTGNFRTTVDDEDVDIAVSLEGQYDNRPPVALFGVEGEGISRIQGGCPPVTGVNPSSTEANDPLGLRLYLQSNSRDPDGLFAESDLTLAQWQHWQGTSGGSPRGTYRFLGRGRRIGPVVFDVDRHHVLVLRVTDRAGASDTTRCEFFVADTMPPSVTAPDPTTVACSVSGGATSRTSERLRKFLAGAVAEDLTDNSPHRLPTRADGVDVGRDTLFPLDETTAVSFRYRDRFGNVGEAVSSVKVVSKLRTDFGLGPGVRTLGGRGGWVKIRPSLETAGPCGMTMLYLATISSDGPEPPHKLVRGAVLGSDDREFELLDLPVKLPDGRLRPRVYELTWVGVDADGKKRQVVEKLVVEPPKRID